MTVEELREEIKVDLGCDVVSLGISDTTIDLKIQEALRKISSYAPRVLIGSFTGNTIVMPEGTTCVLEILTESMSDSSTAMTDDVFSWSTVMLNSGVSLYDPTSVLTMRQEAKALQSFIRIKDWEYVSETRTLYISGLNKSRVTVKYMVPYQSLSEVTDEIVIQNVKEYALALCKIAEGMIRRKLQNTPGAMQLDGDALVSEGTSERDRLNSDLPKIFKYLRMGLRV